MKYATQIFIDDFTMRHKAEIDLLVDNMFCKFKSSEDSNMPRKIFSKGMTNLTKITADEEAGMAFTLLLLAQTELGQKIFDTRFDVENNVDVDDCSLLDGNRTGIADNLSYHCTYRNFVQVVEMLLSFHAWYKSKKAINWTESSYELILHSIKEMLFLVKTTLPRKDGYGWKIQKFHELLHVPIDVMNFGSPKNFDTGIMENRLIHVGKINALSTQKRGPKIFTRQLGLRIHEKQCFDKAWRCNKHLLFNDDDKSDSTLNNSTSSNVSSISFLDNIPISLESKYSLRKVPDCTIQKFGNNYCQTKWRNKNINFNESVENFLCKLLIAESNQTIYQIYTCIKVNGLIYRANPSFRGIAWYDWAVIRFEASDDDRCLVEYNKNNNTVAAYPAGYYPAKLLGFIKTNNSIKVLIHSTETKTNSIHDSCLTERFYLEYERKIVVNNQNIRRNVLQPKFRIVDVQNIHERIYVVEETPGIHSELNNLEENNKKSNLVLHVKKYETWGNYFT